MARKDSKPKSIQIPIIGKLTAWHPKANKNRDPNTYFALRMTGNTMSTQGIFDGDIVVVKNL